MLYNCVTMVTVELPGCGSWLIERLGFSSRSIAGDPASVWCGCVGLSNARGISVWLGFLAISIRCWVRPDPSVRPLRCCLRNQLIYIGDGDAGGRERDPRGRGFSFGAIDRR